MTDEATQSEMDAEANRETYNAVMKIGGEVGVPFSLALTMFFTNLVLANGIIFSLFAAILTYVFSYVFVKLFFSH